MVLRTTAAMAATLALLTACAKAPETAPPADATADAAAHTDAAHAAVPAAAPTRTPAPAGAELYIISPKDGETVTSPVTVLFGLSGMGVAPAGVQFEHAGHHHLLIDTDLPADLSLPVPTDDHHVHFGKGQTQASVPLTPGTHTLQLVLGDYLHIPFDPVVASPKITITVK
ncbi:MAG: DUF4399 domain-containing protein [Steroidobacteraceae bacterium]